MKFDADASVATPQEHSTVFNFPLEPGTASSTGLATSPARSAGPILKKSILMTMATMSMALNYPATNAGFGTMHVVRGEDRLGLLVDTGASSALMGTDTLRKHLKQIVESMGAMSEVTYGPSNSLHRSWWQTREGPRSMHATTRSTMTSWSHFSNRLDWQ